MHLYDLPTSLLESLIPLQDGSQPVEPQPVEPVEPSFQPNQPSQLDASACSYCGPISSKDHYRSDWHRYNIHRRLKGFETVSADQFEVLLDSLDTESLSGSDSDESEGEDPTDTLTVLMKNTSVQENSANVENLVQADPNKGKPGSPYWFYQSPQLDQDQVLAVYKQATTPESSAQALQLLKLDHSSLTSAVIMMGGGHFAAAIFHHKLHPKTRPSQNNPYAHVQVVAQQSYHRYTTRRKQGGAQGVSGGKAISAGASLRRHNEQELEKDVRATLETWRPLLAACHHIYVRANGKINRTVLFNYDRAPLHTADPRLRTLPFTTKRATATEVKRSWLEVCLVRYMAKNQDSNGADANAKALALEKSKVDPKAQTRAEPKPKLSVLETQSDELAGFIKRSRAPKLSVYLHSHKLDPNLVLEPESRFGPGTTLLHYAASVGSHHIVTTLLMALKADPTLIDGQGRTAAQLTHQGAVSDAFQLCRSALGEQAWDWAAAKVGPALTKADIERRTAQEVQERDRIQKQELEALEQSQAQRRQDHIVAKHGPGKLLNVATSLGQDASLRGLSDEARMKLERERRARAAEARFKR